MSISSAPGPILVTGATGKQGGAVIRALLKAGRTVRALTRDPHSVAGKTLSAQGVEVVKGDFNDSASLYAALTGADGVFSMQMGSHPGDPETEVVTGRALVEAAHSAGVRVIVHTSVARAGDQKNFIGWDEARWEPLYWNNKAAVNDMVKAQGFPYWVILKPAMIMENLIPPMVDFMYPSLAERGQFETAIESDTRLDWIAAQDIGAFAAAAFADPENFHGNEIDLSAECVTMAEIATKMTEATGKQVLALTFSEDELVKRGDHALMIRGHVWDNVEGYKVDIDGVRSWGIPLTTFDEFIEQNRDKFIIG